MNKNEYEKILECLQGTVNSEKRRKQLETFEVRNGKLYKKKKNGKVLRVLKEDETDAILFMTHNHETGGHFGVDTTYNKIADRYYWKGMYDDIKKYVKNCDTCQRRGQKGGKSYLNPIEVGEPFERIGIDFVGPLERTKRRNRYILVVTDYLTKWPEAKAMKEATAENVVEEENILKKTYDLINLTEERENVRRNIGESQEKQKERYDRKIGYETKLKIGDKVLLKDAAKEKQ